MFIRNSIFIILLSAVCTLPALALKATSSGKGSNTYLFIENNVDKEYFITSGSLDPRFSGSNVWTKYKTKQVSLGYMSNIGWSNPNRYIDMWITDSPIIQPFLGIRCMTTGANCPASGYIAPNALDSFGFYHARTGGSLENGSYGAATLSPSAYEYFRSRSVSTTDVFELNLCYMSSSNGDYDYASGTRCKDLTSNAYWRYYSISLEKVGHLTLKGTGAMAEIWVASDGMPSIHEGSELCQTGIVSGVSGIICKMISYDLQQSKALTTSLKFRMVIDTATLGFSPAGSEVKYSGDAATWTNYSSSAVYNKIFITGGEYVYVFLSKDFFKKSVNAGTDLTNKESLFTFDFNNSITPESGYYQFTPSTQLNILPKDYGISIISSDGSAAPSASGKIGDDQPITFEYTVTTSAPRQADSITAQVTGESTQLDGVPWCVFSSDDGTLKVPIPAYLSWISASGNEVKTRNSCSEDAVDITQALWTQTAWNANLDNSFFFTTKLKLLFPMNDSRSLFSVDGSDWMGNVKASGEVKVTATWVGVDR